MEMENCSEIELMYCWGRVDFFLVGFLEGCQGFSKPIQGPQIPLKTHPNQANPSKPKMDFQN
jgi:hypothetical protein